MKFGELCGESVESYFINYCMSYGGASDVIYSCLLSGNTFVVFQCARTNLPKYDRKTKKSYEEYLKCNN